jgi:transcriptional regulator with XRE-family HTH domain
MGLVGYDDALGRFGRRVQVLRGERRITQEQMAERIDVSVEHISYLERGVRAPSFETILRLARALDVSVPYLMNIDQNETSADFLAELPAAAAPSALVQPVEDAITTRDERQSDITRLRSALHGVQELQQLARDYAIADIFQDNGGKVLECLILTRVHPPVLTAWPSISPHQETTMREPIPTPAHLPPAR